MVPGEQGDLGRHLKHEARADGGGENMWSGEQSGPCRYGRSKGAEQQWAEVRETAEGHYKDLSSLKKIDARRLILKQCSTENFSHCRYRMFKKLLYFFSRREQGYFSVSS